MFRFNAAPAQNGIMKQVAAILKKKVDQSISNQIRKQVHGTRSSPRKSNPTKPSQPKPSKQNPEPEPEKEKDMGSSTLFIDEEPEPEKRVHLDFINPSLDQEEEDKESQSPVKVEHPRNAFEILKLAKSPRKPVAKTKKLTKKASKNSNLEQSSILDSFSSHPASKINGNVLPRKRVSVSIKFHA